MIASALHTINGDFRRIKSSVKLMGVIAGFKFLGIGIIDPFLALYFYQLSGDYGLVGVWFSMLGFASLVSLIPFMRLADHVKNKLVVWRGLELYAVACLFYFLAGFYQNFLFIFVALFLHGVGMTMVDAGSESFIRKHTSSSRAPASFGYFYSLRSLGWFLGMLLGAFLVNHFFTFDSLHQLFLLVIPFMLINFLLIGFVHERGISSIRRSLHRYFAHVQDFFGIFRDMNGLDHRMRLAYLVTFFDGLVIVLAISFIPLFAASESLSPVQIAFMLAAIHVPTLFAFVLSEMTKKWNRITLILLGLSLASVSTFLLFWISSSFWILILSALMILGVTFMRPAYNAFITDFTPKGMLGEISSVRNFLIGSAIMITPFIFGNIADFFGIRFVFLFTSIVALLLIVITLLMCRRFS